MASQLPFSGRAPSRSRIGRGGSLSRGIGLVALAAAAWGSAPSLAYAGVNLAGAEFGEVASGRLGVFGKDYTYPTAEEVRYFRRKGMNVFRIPFRWERLQPQPGAALDPAEASRLRAVVREVLAAGAVAILDPHNFARYYGKTIGGPDVPISAFADLWAHLAKEFARSDRVWFGLMNEPHDMPTETWLRAANAALTAIRSAGAKNLVLVPGNHWSGAHSWTTSDNARWMAQVRNPGRHFAYEVHQYLDRDSSGTHAEVVSPTIGPERLAAFTAWCRERGAKAFLGETAAPATAEGRAAIRNLLLHLKENSDVWLGFAWWAAGPWWGDSMFSLEPKDGKDRPQMEYLREFLRPGKG